MKNLGKIALIIFLFPYAIFAGVTASVDSHTVTLGDTVTLSLDITGSDVTKPNIQTLCGTDVTSTGSQTSIVMNNGDYKKSNIATYQFTPQKSCTIEPIELTIDGVKEKTEAINIVVKTDVTATKDTEFSLELTSDKKEVFVGEPFEVALLFKQKNNAAAVDSSFTPPQFTGFWKKDESKPVRYQQGDYTITKVIYTLSAQRAGSLNIAQAQMKIATRVGSRDMWGSFMPQVKWRTYFSNELKLDAKPLPAGVNLVGTYTISAKADKSEINTNEAVNVTIEVHGDGNLEDIKSFKPYIDGVSVFDEKIVIDGSKLTQKLAFVADADFVIPSFSIKSYDLKSKEIKTVATKEIQVKVKNAKPKEELTIKRDENREVIAPTEKHMSRAEMNYYWIVFGFIVGLVCGVAITLLRPWKFFSKTKTVSIKEPKLLLVKLMPYKNDAEVQKLVDILEKNIYSHEKNEIDKKVLKEIIKKYNIS